MPCREPRAMARAPHFATGLAGAIAWRRRFAARRIDAREGRRRQLSAGSVGPLVARALGIFGLRPAARSLAFSRPTSGQPPAAPPRSRGALARGQHASGEIGTVVSEKIHRWRSFDGVAGNTANRAGCVLVLALDHSFGPIEKAAAASRRVPGDGSRRERYPAVAMDSRVRREKFRFAARN